MSLVLKNCGRHAVGQGGIIMVAGLQMLLWIGIVGLLVLSVRLVGEGAEYWKRAFVGDYEREVCGRYQALEANMMSAVALWRKLGCEGEEELGVEEEVAGFLEEWREQHGEVDLEKCEGVRLHRERNAALDQDYPNWVLRYE